ncbi:hypothetical protein T439DRAFT_304717 [Meredithblackwellia eburnea MCA 4105]
MLLLSYRLRTIAFSSHRRMLATLSKVPSPSVTTINPSALERSAGKLSPRNQQTALEALHRDGLLMLEDMVDHDHLDKLNVRMIEDAYTLRDRKDSPYNYNRGNIQQDPPAEPELFFSDIFYNKMVISITSAYLGGKPQMTFNSGNTALKATEGQPVHTDADFAHPSIPFALVVNTPLVAMSPENGSTEVWLGTHTMAGLDAQEGLHGERASGRIKANLMAARREVSPPFQPVTKKGNILIRDLRLWHCGRPNFTDTPRVMLAQIHFAPWYRNSMKLEFPKSMEKSITELENIEIPSVFTEAPPDHLNRPFGNAYDFGPGN